MIFLRLLGGAFIAAAALCVGRGYRAYARQRLDEQEGFLSLLLHIKGQVACYLSPQGKLLEGFRSEALSRLGFTDAMEECRDLSAAYKQVEHGLCVSEKIKAVLERYFLGFGKEYKEGELARADAAIAEISALFAADKAETEKNVKVAEALSVAAALGLIILLL